jgi:hypothetical protein
MADAVIAPCNDFAAMALQGASARRLFVQTSVARSRNEFIRSMIDLPFRQMVDMGASMAERQ